MVVGEDFIGQGLWKGEKPASRRQNGCTSRRRTRGSPEQTEGGTEGGRVRREGRRWGAGRWQVRARREGGREGEMGQWVVWWLPPTSDVEEGEHQDGHQHDGDDDHGDRARRQRAGGTAVAHTHLLT